MHIETWLVVLLDLSFVWPSEGLFIHIYNSDMRWHADHNALTL